MRAFVYDWPAHTRVCKASGKPHPNHFLGRLHHGCGGAIAARGARGRARGGRIAAGGAVTGAALGIDMVADDGAGFLDAACVAWHDGDANAVGPHDAGDMGTADGGAHAAADGMDEDEDGGARGPALVAAPTLADGAATGDGRGVTLGRQREVVATWDPDAEADALDIVDKAAEDGEEDAVNDASLPRALVERAFIVADVPPDGPDDSDDSDSEDAEAARAGGCVGRSGGDADGGDGGAGAGAGAGSGRGAGRVFIHAPPGAVVTAATGWGEAGVAAGDVLAAAAAGAAVPGPQPQGRCLAPPRSRTARPSPRRRSAPRTQPRGTSQTSGGQTST